MTGASKRRNSSELLKGMLCHVNLIPLNPVPESGFERSSREASGDLPRFVRARGIKVTVRRERGTDIQAACGQLRRSRER